ncbi:pitrilysin family protein [Pseudogemmatithrix spongiicola]|uniref:Pitrilysin family protein n=1 Tax=Pseudogemmatithrix spongiicola TaxID=3062599 RepID=A0AA49Q578_9BACT|nr:pitrilysin family protein [Gemmatimonadaceae bacterium 'strain 138']WKW15534.1 pitrilysin family protein [Gemmatimonadaceae bacterium 'strain 318']
MQRLRHGLLAMACALPLAAQQPTPVKIESFTLTNGLKVHVVEDHSAQVVAVNVWYDVGSRNERPGRTGFAHLFEHMMFQGSQNVGKMEHGQLVERAGGTYNGSTQPDRTNYFQTVPSNRLNLALWLEADRMRSLVISAENLENQRQAVKEERRLRVDNQPYSAAFIDSLPLLFDRERCFAYAHSIIGSMADLDAASVDDVRDFFRTHYAPNTATLVVVGDVTPQQVMRLTQQYFGNIPAGPARDAVRCDAAPGVGSASVRRVADEKASLPAVLTAVRVVAPSHADYPALALLSTILGEGESSRLNRAMVRGSKSSVAVQALHDPFGPMRGAGVFGALAIANGGVPVDSVRSELARELFDVADRIDAEELEKAKNAWRARTIFGRQRAADVAEALQFADMYLGSPDALNTEAARYAAVTLADMRRVARTYLRPERSLTLVIAPEDR